MIDEEGEYCLLYFWGGPFRCTCWGSRRRSGCAGRRGLAGRRWILPPAPRAPRPPLARASASHVEAEVVFKWRASRQKTGVPGLWSHRLGRCPFGVPGMDDVWPEKEAHMSERSEFMRFPAGHRPCREPRRGSVRGAAKAPAHPSPARRKFTQLNFVTKQRLAPHADVVCLQHRLLRKPQRIHASQPKPANRADDPAAYPSSDAAPCPPPRLASKT
jgi:hypothetical protein